MLRMTFGPTTPVFRIFDLARAREFYLDYLGFTVDWEHRFRPELPLYMQVSRGQCTIHLTEHHGDACPGAAVRIQTTELDALFAELSAKSYRYARPAIEAKPWGSRDLVQIDPFGNRLTFTQPS